ncbi:MAG: hypothetical protein ACOVOW_07245, partial [Spirosomataceae bacterium]
MSFKKNRKLNSDFQKVTISLASPESILEGSHGEVTQPETINYRTYKPEMGGLFCERIFGPTKDWECHCGKYKRIRYKGIICDRCGVEVTEKKVRRERMGHIELVVPVAHIWYFRSLPNKIGYLLGLSTKKLDQVIYYERYVVVQAGVKEEDGVNKMDFLTEDEYLDIVDKLPRENQLLPDEDPQKFIAKMGAEALEMLLKRSHLDDLSYSLRHAAANDTSQQRKAEALKRLKVVEAFREAGTRIENKPEWMVIKMVPVIPPELRPLVPLDGGRFATSDLNDLYRRVIIRKKRFKRLIEIKATKVKITNQKTKTTVNLKKSALLFIFALASGKAVSQSNSDAKTETFLKELATNGCLCIDSISTYNKSKVDLAKNVSNCINKQASVLQMGS